MLYEQSQDRCRGLMVGLGVGNVLGVPQESWPRYAVEASYPNGIREIELGPGEPDDDDLAQAIILAEVAIDAGAGELDIEEIGRRFWVWAEENGRGIGIQTADVLCRIGGDMPRCAGGAGVRAREPSGQPALEAARQVWDPRCIWSAAVVNVAIAMLLRSEAVEVPGVVARSRQAAEQLGDSLADFRVAGAVPEAVLEACSIPSGITPADLVLDGHDMGYTLKAMQVALWCADQAADFEKALVAVVSAGGDTDTNGAVAGAALGARFGLNAIPSRWRERLAEVRQGREPLEVLADRVVGASGSAVQNP